MDRSARVLALLVGGVSGVGSLPAQAHPRDLVRAVTAAVDAGRADSARRAIETRIRSSPRDLAAQFALATLDRLVYRHAAAEARYRTLAGAAPPVRAWASLGLGSSLVQRWDSSGVSVLARAMAQGDSIRDAEVSAHAILVQTRFVGRFVRPDSILTLVTLARRLAPASDSGLTATALCAEAVAIRTRGLAAADSLARAGAELATAARDRRAEARCWVTASQIAEARGLQSEAQRRIRLGLAAQAQTRDLDLGATADQTRAYQLIQYSFGLGDARRLARRAIARGTASGNRLSAGYARLNLAQLAIRLGDFRHAGLQLDSARSLLASLGDRAGLAASDFVAGDAAFARGRHADAERGYRASLAGYRALGSPVTQVLLRLALLSAERGAPARADSFRTLVAQDAERFNLLGIKRDLVYFEALAALKQGQYPAAAAGFRDYAETLSAGAGGHKFDARLREAEALALGGRLAEAEAAVDSAFAQLEEVRNGLKQLRILSANRDVVAALATNRRFEFDPDLGMATIVGRLAAGGRAESAFRLADAERARSLWVQMARRGMLGVDTADLSPKGRIAFPTDTPLDELRAALDERTAILAFTGGAGGEPTTLFVLDRSRLSAFRLPPTDSLAEPIQRFTDQIEGGGYPRPLARELGRVLVDTAVALLPERVNRLIIIPDGPLYRLPFDALLLSNQQPLVTRFAVATALSARLTVEWMSRPAAQTKGRVLAFGDPRFDPAAGLARLPGSGREARNAAGAGGSVLLGAQATEAELKTTDWTRVSVLHLATHARTEDWGILSSAVHLAPGGSDDGRLGPDEIASASIPVDLVVLSGCRTTGGVVVFGEGIQGLVAPFLEAGARAVLATYWEVGDQRIRPMVERFYRELRSGATAGDALHAAKRAALLAGQPPRTWAAFGLTGDAAVRPLGPRAP